MTFWVAGAVVGSAVIGSMAAGDAADASAASSAASIAEQRRQYDVTREDYAPWREAGRNALTQLQSEMGRPTTAADAMSDPGYRFGQQQGQLGLDRKFGAMGGRVSGAAMKAASRFNTDYASSGYGAAYQRRQDSLNRLAALAGLGQTAAAGGAAAGANSANAISSTLMNQGETAAGARMAQGSMWANTGNQLGSLMYRSQMPGFNGNSMTGYTYQQPWTVGPQPG